MTGRLLFLVYVIYCFEIGVFLTVYPWMDLWRHNALLFHYPALRPFLLNDFLKGAISGLGISNIILGTWEIVHFKYFFKTEP